MTKYEKNTDYERMKSILCLTDPKYASLFCDHVFPIDPYWFLPQFGSVPKTGVLSIDNDKMIKVEKEIIPGHADNKIILDYVRESELFLREFEQFLETILFDKNTIYSPICRNLSTKDSAKRLLEFTIELMTKYETIFDKLPAKDLWTQAQLLSLAYMYDLELPKSGQFRKIVFRRFPILERLHLPVIVPRDILSANDTINEDITLNIGNLNLIDVNRISWDQIIELRKDSESRSKLRNFHLFVFTNYKDKSRAFIEDDLRRRIEEYEYLCKSHDLETFISTTSILMNSKSLLTTIVASAGAALFGDALIAGGTLAAGAFIEIGKISLEVAKRKNSFNKLSNHHELAYIVDIKKKML